MEKLQIIKIGGNCIDDPQELEKFLSAFSKIDGNKILVHGGGMIATDLAKSLGISSEMIEGRRVTDAETLKLITMVYGGLINKNIVAKLQSLNCNAIGLTGADANLMPAKIRSVIPIDYGFVGDVESDSINVEFIKFFLNSGLSPVFAPLTHDENGNMLNTNADTIAATLAMALTPIYKVSLIYCFEKNGVLRDAQVSDSVIHKLSVSEYRDLKVQGVITHGMIPKLDNAFQALKEGVKQVRVCNSNALTEFKEINLQGTELIL